jgi:hypothetical protein
LTNKEGSIGLVELGDAAATTPLIPRGTSRAAVAGTPFGDGACDVLRSYDTILVAADFATIRDEPNEPTDG